MELWRIKVRGREILTSLRTERCVVFALESGLGT